MLLNIQAYSATRTEAHERTVWQQVCVPAAHGLLAHAQGDGMPLLERLRYLCISCTNLDEFFEIRAATVRQALDFGDVCCLVGFDDLLLASRHEVPSAVGLRLRRMEGQGADRRDGEDQRAHEFSFADPVHRANFYWRLGAPL